MHRLIRHFLASANELQTRTSTQKFGEPVPIELSEPPSKSSSPLSLLRLENLKRKPNRPSFPPHQST